MSGAPKIKAIELISLLEQEKRGVYAGAVGRWDFADDEMDTCIAIRTMVFKNGVAYLQAGGGIVSDSVEEDEYVETLNKLKGNMRALEIAEGEILHGKCLECILKTHADFWYKAQQAHTQTLHAATT